MRVTTVGHSLREDRNTAALLDGVYFRLQLDLDVAVIVVVYGMPRVDDQDSANYVDSTVFFSKTVIVIYINERMDVTPIISSTDPYQPSGGEIHIQESGDWIACSSHDNMDPCCTTGFCLHR